MARSRYVSYNSRRKKNKNFVFFIVSLITIVVFYVVLRQFWTGDETIDRQPEQPAQQDSSQAQQAAEETEEALRNVEPPSQPRAEVKPDMDTIVDPEKPRQEDDSALPDTGLAEEMVSEAAKDTDKDFEPEKSQEQILEEKIEDITAEARAGEIIESRDKLLSIMKRNPESSHQPRIKTLLAKLAEQWLFSKKVLSGDECCEYYTVQSGDLLSKIGKKYNVPWEFLLKINDLIRPENLRAGETIKVVNGPFNGVISRSRFIMDLYLDDIYVKTYRVGLGRDEHQTPTGLWVVDNNKLVSPRWTDPDTGRTYDAADPDYPLGKRWIGLKGVAGNAEGREGFALHGTNEPESIGQRRSRGCIRLKDEDILEVYDMMTPGKSQVQIVD